MSYSTFFRAFMGALASVGLILLGGCDNTLDPFAEETGQFSIYGHLTLSNDQHFLRIKDLNDPVGADSRRTLDATVTLKNLDTGTTEMLADSIVTFGGVYTHNFRTTQDIRSGHTYRVSVEPPDGRGSRATATMPPRTQLSVEPAEPGALGCDEALVLRFQNVPKPRLLRVGVGIYWSNQWRWVDVTNSNATFIGFKPWRIVEEALPDVTLRVLEPPEYCTLLDDPRFRIAYTHFGPDWPADSVRAAPTVSTVENGLGVFGGVHQDTLIRTVDTSSVL